MSYDKILHFKGTWRTYQARVLKNADKYLADGKIHIVAAPGSGKTTLGIELIGRLGKPTLILAPSIAIREQWKARIIEGFLVDGLNPDDYISQDLKNPSLFTIATYQSLHSAMNRLAGDLKDEAADDSDDEAANKLGTEKVDFSHFDIIKTMKDMNLGVICLDECHHLRNEWWKALEQFKDAIKPAHIISLTATPPYDSTPALWTRYMDMCGPIDEEISIPELVKEGSLCPHQDFVYFNFPTKAETDSINIFKKQAEEMTAFLMSDSQFESAIRGHAIFQNQIPMDEILEDPSYLSALLIFMNEKHISFPKSLQKTLGASSLPHMSTKWMEVILTHMLYSHPDHFPVDTVYREQLSASLKQKGLIEKRKICLSSTAAIEKLLTSSKGKINSIMDIVQSEYSDMGSKLRMLILTDYIRKEYEKAIGDDRAEILSLGVLPFFENIRREFAKKNAAPKLGVLCGTMVIIPASAKDSLLTAIGDKGSVTFGQLGSLSDEEYVKVIPTGDNHFLTAAITEIFGIGEIEVLIGTKSLLGEGWDSPCINSLILASFVGSFMLSNQMRGRAIRVMKDNPDKTSNIWHLVCLMPEKLNSSDSSQSTLDPANSQDMELLKRRMDHFLGLHYTIDSIETGIDRLSIIKPPFNKNGANTMNSQMLELSKKRNLLKERWNKALEIKGNMELVEEVEPGERNAPVQLILNDYIKQLALAGVATAGAFCLTVMAHGSGPLTILGLAGLVGTINRYLKVKRLSSPLKRLEDYGKGTLKALQAMSLIESKNCRVAVESEGGAQAISLKGGSARDKAIFIECMNDFFDDIDNQRYILVNPKRTSKSSDYFAVPTVFSKKKEDAQVFADCLKPFIGKYDLIYTRNEAGRQLLLEGRLRALANIQNRAIRHTKVKSALE